MSDALFAGRLQSRKPKCIVRSDCATQIRWQAVGGINVGFITWIVVGLIAGWLAGRVMKGGGYGVLMDIVLGILGGFVGGWLFGMLGIWPGGGLVGSIIVAFVGAILLVWISRLLKKA